MASYYPDQQQNRAGLSKITFCIYQNDMSLFQIHNKAFFIKTFIHNVGFLPQNIL